MVRRAPRLSVVLPVLLVLLGVGCAAPPGEGAIVDPELPVPARAGSCQVSPLDTVRRVKPCAKGSGIFGYWVIDDSGLPAYEYRLDQLHDQRARYGHTVDPTRTDHFHQLGNQRLNAIAYNDGVVSLVSQERGVTFHDRYEPSREHYGGGFSIIAAAGDDEREVWNTAYRWRPSGALARRRFGAGYYETVTQHDGLRVTHRLSVPTGGDPLLIDEVTLENLRPAARRVSHYEYWDVNRYQAKFQPLRTGGIAQSGDSARRQLNGPFVQSVERDGDVVKASLALREGQSRPGRDRVSATDFYPAPVFAAALDRSPQQVYTDRQAFIGDATIRRPAAAVAGRAGELLAPHPGLEQRTALILRHDLTIEGKSRQRLRFAYGYLPRGTDLRALLARHRDTDTAKTAGNRWRARLAYLAVPDAPELSRELPWHAYYLLSATTRTEFFDTRVTPQGSAYFYLHGFDGAPRDQALFSLALTYLDPSLARANIEQVMRMTRAKTGSISYSYHGHGVLEKALIHEHPSDLDLFLLVAVYEYLAATGDSDFLANTVPFYPRAATPAPPARGKTVLDHLRVAVAHLIETVGRGPNGLIRVRDGDWSDGVVYQRRDKIDVTKTLALGESIPNTQMAVYVLPRLARLLEPHDAQLAAKMGDYAAELRAPLRAQLRGDWFLRAYLRDKRNRPLVLGKTTPDLEAQPWGLIAEDLLTAAQKARVAKTMRQRLDTVLGPALTPHGMVWPAIGQLATWAYRRVDDAYAWRALRAQSLANKATRFPEQWFGIWSAPDGLYSSSGNTWRSVATPMRDWPVMNANAHAMFLLGTLRWAGVEPSGAGLRIQPPTTPKRFALALQLLELKVDDDELQATYHPQNNGVVRLELAPPRGHRLTDATLEGKPVSDFRATSAKLRLKLERGKPIRFGATWR